MGGRGTFASGNNVAYKYKTIGSIEGIKVLQGIGGIHELPEETHSSPSYIALNQDGTVKQIRLYNKNLTAKLDIELPVHRGKLLLHVHDYIKGVRQDARELTVDEKRLFNKFFRGVL